MNQYEYFKKSCFRFLFQKLQKGRLSRPTLSYAAEPRTVEPGTTVPSDAEPSTAQTSSEETGAVAATADTLNTLPWS